MLIHPCEEEYLFSALPMEAGNHIGEHFLIGVADMRRTIGVINGGGDKIVFFHCVDESVLAACGRSGGVSSIDIFPPQERMRAFTPADSASAI